MAIECFNFAKGKILPYGNIKSESGNRFFLNAYQVKVFEENFIQNTIKCLFWSSVIYVEIKG